MPWKNESSTCFGSTRMRLHTSGPIAMVVAGLFMGNHGRFFGMSDDTRNALDGFWEVVDEILQGVAVPR